MSHELRCHRWCLGGCGDVTRVMVMSHVVSQGCGGVTWVVVMSHAVSHGLRQCHRGHGGVTCGVVQVIVMSHAVSLRS